VEREGKFVLLKAHADPAGRHRAGRSLRLRATAGIRGVDDPVPGGLEPVNTDLAPHPVDAKRVSLRRGDSFWFSFPTGPITAAILELLPQGTAPFSRPFLCDYLPAGIIISPIRHRPCRRLISVMRCMLKKCMIGCYGKAYLRD